MWRGQLLAQMPVLQGKFVDYADQAFDVGAELLKFGLVLLAQFFEPHNLFAEPGLGVRGVPALFDLGVELVF
ncbi:hypothetical protein DJ64_00380 [Streptomyces griseorubens]|uniref:Uncharacterized protein n=1 Tax=Streptomyces griseorubens TaxID=66897 RepID=A0ABR4TAE8_9ACTN|nr:hypothetical protein DJ64_00380 [Streptomyces griseorubens]